MPNIQSKHELNTTVYLKDVKSDGTNGGTFTSGAWRTRDLNVMENAQDWVALAVNQFILQPGKYKIKAIAPAYATARHKAKLRNITDSTDDILGESTHGVAGPQNTSSLMGIIEITASKTFEIQHYCATTFATTGFGVASNFAVNEIYTQVEIQKIG